ncbi:MAG: IS66 family insertion sequence element accessory protein TnpB [Succinatimonas sp.]|jgi:hypothetical protein|nr:IS66 family insertion sequence element accessory protein TnpB [Succinatimonas sp.]MDD5867819.1 IS66 family insertion sequence element accessory protein TnpB [Succinatimonas sp.]MDY5721401.1 IS66 family insertion sequence element accessory protein TnpB [Succinivibrio sp.]
MSSAILPSEGRIVMVKEPVSGRFGVHKLMAHLTMNTYGTAWDGDETITLVTFNKKRTRMKILTADRFGITYSVRILNAGTFKVILGDELLCEHINKKTLENLIRYGTTAEL